MHVVKIVVWQVDEAWLGYLQEYPDYWTQGKSLEDLREHLTQSAGLHLGADRLHARKAAVFAVETAVPLRIVS